MSRIYEISGDRFWRWVYGAFILGTVLGIVLGIIGFLILLAMLTVIIAPV